MRLQPAPKPSKPEPSSALAKQYMDFVAQTPCICSGRYGVQLHHPTHGRFATRRASDFDVIPLCYDFHLGKKYGVHEQVDWWRANFGDDCDYIPTIRARVKQMARNTIGKDYSRLVAKINELEEKGI